jgi:UDP-glucuronate 4-epimerase
MKILVTGCAGFIGMHVALNLLRSGHDVVGLDNVNSYYDVNLKEARLNELRSHKKFIFHKIDIANRQDMIDFFAKENLEIIIHLAAQAGVRYSVEHPEAYVDSNLVGFANILEGARTLNVKHLLYASSSSVYGGNKKIPFAEGDGVDCPVSFYAATKKANELMAYSYSSVFKIPTTGLRFFTVYGPWGRPDMSPFLFTKAILAGEPIKVFNHGNMMRDFTYIDDIVEGVVRVMDKPSFDGVGSMLDQADTSLNQVPYQLFNIGNNSPVQLLAYIQELELALGKSAQKLFLPMQLGDVPKTMADIDKLENFVGFKPKTSLGDGIQKFVKWYKQYYHLN